MKVIYNDGHVGEIEKDQELHVIRHTAAHVMAQAIKRLHPRQSSPMALPPSAASTMMWIWGRKSSPMRIFRPSKPK